MQVETVTEINGGSGVRCTAVEPSHPGLVVTADVERHEGRLMVTQLWVAQDQFQTQGGVAEITRPALRAIDPPAIIRALTDYLGGHDDLVVEREWFRSVDSRSGLTMVANIEAAKAVADGATAPRRAGRPPKLNEGELVQWARVALAVDATRPRSLHKALAEQMSASGDTKLAHSTDANARDLIKTLRAAGLLNPARKSGAREPLAAGPNLPMED